VCTRWWIYDEILILKLLSDTSYILYLYDVLANRNSASWRTTGTLYIIHVPIWVVPRNKQTRQYLHKGMIEVDGKWRFSLFFRWRVKASERKSYPKKRRRSRVKKWRCPYTIYIYIIRCQTVILCLIKYDNSIMYLKKKTFLSKAVQSILLMVNTCDIL